MRHEPNAAALARPGAATGASARGGDRRRLVAVVGVVSLLHAGSAVLLVADRAREAAPTRARIAARSVPMALRTVEPVAPDREAGVTPSQRSIGPRTLRTPSAPKRRDAAAAPAGEAGTSPNAEANGRDTVDATVRAPPGEAAPAAPPDERPLDLRHRGGSANRSVPSVRPAEAEPVARAAALEQAIQRSARPDCRTAHAGTGLLAVPMLLVDAVRDGGCRW